MRGSRAFALLCAGAVLTSCSEAGPAGPDASGDGRIDPLVAARMGSDDRIPVFVLARDQLLLGPGALDAFARSRASSARPRLRRRVVEALKERAGADRDSLEALVAGGEHVQPLWLVNGISALLTGGQIRSAASSRIVRHVYLVNVTRADFDRPGRIGTVLPPGEDRPFDPEGRVVPWNVEALGAAAVWRDFGVTGRGTVVALLDAGVRYLHSDLRGRLWVNEGEVPNNGADDDGNGYADDLYGMDMTTGRVEVLPTGSEHGTWVAGIVAGDGTGGTVTGVAPGTRLMPLVTFGSVSSLLGLQYALENGADVANMSFSLGGLGNFRGVWRLAADHATAAGLVLVSGASNNRGRISVPEQMRIPEAIPSVVAVGGVDRDLEPAGFSSTGPVGWGEVLFYGDHPYPPGLVKPDVAAFPGPGYPFLDPGGGYIRGNAGLRGNSFSGPHAAGAAALVLSADPSLPAWEVGRILEATARDLGAPGKDVRTGAGLIDVRAAVARALAVVARP